MNGAVQGENRARSSAKPEIAELHDPARFEVIAEVAHQDVIRFVQPYIFQFSWITALYWLLNAAVLAIIFRAWLGSRVPASEAFPTVCLGMVLGFLVLLPIHEYVHAIAYRMCGARVVRVKYNLRRVTALCEAPGAVVSGREFVLVCLAPLVVLNPILTFSLLFLVEWKAFALLGGALLLHTGGCSGDVGLVNFVWRNRRRALFTYDDGERQRAWFFKDLRR